MLRINVGCGATPTKGWRNFDNSGTLRLARWPIVIYFLRCFRLISPHQVEFIRTAQVSHIEYGDVITGLPLSNGSVDVLYSSHMLEHLDQESADAFLKEARRVLASGGMVRLAVPDLKMIVDSYLRSGDANAFMNKSGLCAPVPRSLFGFIRLPCGLRQPDIG